MPIILANCCKVFKTSCGIFEKSIFNELKLSNTFKRDEIKLLLFCTGMPTGKIPGRIPINEAKSKKI